MTQVIQWPPAIHMLIWRPSLLKYNTCIIHSVYCNVCLVILNLIIPNIFLNIMYLGSEACHIAIGISLAGRFLVLCPGSRSLLKEHPCHDIVFIYIGK